MESRRKRERNIDMYEATLIHFWVACGDHSKNIDANGNVLSPHTTRNVSLAETEETTPATFGHFPETTRMLPKYQDSGTRTHSAPSLRCLPAHAILIVCGCCSRVVSLVNFLSKTGHTPSEGRSWQRRPVPQTSRRTTRGVHPASRLFPVGREATLKSLREHVAQPHGAPVVDPFVESTQTLDFDVPVPQVSTCVTLQCSHFEFANAEANSVSASRDGVRANFLTERGFVERAT